MKTDVSLPNSSGPPPMIHATACVDQPCQIGAGTKIWHYSHIMPGAVLGTSCNIGQNVFIASGVRLGNNVKVQNNVSLYEGCILEDDVFCGPSAVFTNVSNSAERDRPQGSIRPDLRRARATIGANSTLVAPIRIGHDALISAGAVATKDVVPYALMMGVPARRVGWVGRAGVPLVPCPEAGADIWICPESAERYRQLDADRLEPDRAEHSQSAS